MSTTTTTTTTASTSTTTTTTTSVPSATNGADPLSAVDPPASDSDGDTFDSSVMRSSRFSPDPSMSRASTDVVLGQQAVPLIFLRERSLSMSDIVDGRPPLATTPAHPSPLGPSHTSYSLLRSPLLLPPSAATTTTTTTNPTATATTAAAPPMSRIPDMSLFQRSRSTPSSGPVPAATTAPVGGAVPRQPPPPPHVAGLPTPGFGTPPRGPQNASQRRSQRRRARRAEKRAAKQQRKVGARAAASVVRQPHGSAPAPAPDPTTIPMVGADLLPDGLPAVPTTFHPTSKCPMLPEEVEEGSTEYKVQLLGITEDRCVHLVTQMRWRMAESTTGREAFYRIGVEDHGNPKGLTDADLHQSLTTLQLIAHRNEADMEVLEVQQGGSPGLNVAYVRVTRRRGSSAVQSEVRVAVVGSVDSGKSTLIGVLTTGGLDNGSGLKRLEVFRHVHEVENGRTSSISHQTLGFDESGAVANYSDAATVSRLSQAEVLSRSCKVVTFVDLAGHEKYLKTTVLGLTGHSPDYTALVVSATAGVLRMTRQHLAVSLALKVPTFVVVTKADLCDESTLKQCLATLTRIIDSLGEELEALVVHDEDDVRRAVEGCRSGVVPVFVTSNVTGQGMDLVKSFFRDMPSDPDWKRRQRQHAEFRICDTFSVPGAGTTIVGGSLFRGVVASGDRLLLGPDGLGRFQPVMVKSIHCRQLPSAEVAAGQSATFALAYPDGSPLPRRTVRKGMVLVSDDGQPSAVSEFEADVVLLEHQGVLAAPTAAATLKPNYEPLVYTGAVRQSARVVKMTKPYLRTGDRARVTFAFRYHPEYVTKGASVVFLSGRTRGVGRVVRTFPKGTSALPSSDGDVVGVGRSGEAAGAGFGAGAGAGAGGGAGGGGAGTSGALFVPVDPEAAVSSAFDASSKAKGGKRSQRKRERLLAMASTGRLTDPHEPSSSAPVSPVVRASSASVPPATPVEGEADVALDQERVVP